MAEAWDLEDVETIDSCSGGAGQDCPDVTEYCPTCCFS